MTESSFEMELCAQTVVPWGAFVVQTFAYSEGARLAALAQGQGVVCLHAVNCSSAAGTCWGGVVVDLYFCVSC